MNKKPYIIILSIVAVLLFLLPLLCIGVSATITSTPKSNFCIVIDAGHGGIDSGAIGVTTGNKESDINLDISLRLGKRLEGLGLKVVYTRTNADGLYGTTDSGYKRRDMQARRNIALQADADLLVSIHLNKFSSKSRRGAQVYHQIDDFQSIVLATAIQNVLNNNVNIPQQGRGFTPSKGDFWMCKIIKPAVIVECGFLSNEKDDLLFNTQEYREQIAYHIFDGIVSYLTKETKYLPIDTIYGTAFR